ncbi:MAG TPA: hypothetical protein VEJ63_18330 [Planctomycetota bacterium]|nr:hypothetical protein [Planctomycetota bacterium]
MKLPRLQLHLSTLLIVSLLAAGLVSLNVRHRVLDSGIFVRHSTNLAAPHEFQANQGRGWPLPFDVWNEYDDLHRLHLGKLMVNIAVCLPLLVIATVAIEWLTRRMKCGAP